jgi:hypothetical protein
MNSILPEKETIASEIELDRQQVFLLFATFGGDVVRTAHAAGVRPVDVLRVAEAEGWMAKLGPIIELQRSQRPGDVERGVNRALNFAQAHRMRLFLEKILSRVCGMSEGELQDYIFTHREGKGQLPGAKMLSTRALADLATALEKCQAMTYLALQDTANDRTRRKEQVTGDDTDAGALHLKIAQAMAEVKALRTPASGLFDAQIELAALKVKEQVKRAEPEPVVSPLDNDDH